MKCETCRWWHPNGMCCLAPMWVENISGNHWCGKYEPIKELDLSPLWAAIHTINGKLDLIDSQLRGGGDEMLNV